LAYEQKKPLFTGAVIKELYARTFEEGIDQEDFSAIYKLFKEAKHKAMGSSICLPPFYRFMG